MNKSFFLVILFLINKIAYGYDSWDDAQYLYETAIDDYNYAIEMWNKNKYKYDEDLYYALFVFEFEEQLIKIEEVIQQLNEIYNYVERSQDKADDAKDIWEDISYYSNSSEANDNTKIVQKFLRDNKSFLNKVIDKKDIFLELKNKYHNEIKETLNTKKSPKKDNNNYSYLFYNRNLHTNYNKLDVEKLRYKAVIEIPSIGKNQSIKMKPIIDTKMNLYPILVSEDMINGYQFKSIINKNQNKLIKYSKINDDELLFNWYDAARFCNELSAAEGLDPFYIFEGSYKGYMSNSNGFRLMTLNEKLLLESENGELIHYGDYQNTEGMAIEYEWIHDIYDQEYLDKVSVDITNIKLMGPKFSIIKDLANGVPEITKRTVAAISQSKEKPIIYYRMSANIHYANFRIVRNISTNSTSENSYIKEELYPKYSDSIYKIGDIGPAGGYIIFDAGERRSWGRYVEIAPVEYMKKGIWSYKKINFKEQRSEFGDTFGIGKKNSEKILDKLRNKNKDSAVKYCEDIIINGYNDWFLPHDNELIFLISHLGYGLQYNFLNDYFIDENVVLWSTTQMYEDNIFKKGNKIIARSLTGRFLKTLKYNEIAYILPFRYF